MCYLFLLVNLKLATDEDRREYRLYVLPKNNIRSEDMYSSHKLCLTIGTMTIITDLHDAGF